MFCPQCRSEFEPRFTHCNDCDVDLVWELPPDDAGHEVELVKVFETGDAALIPVVESLLHDAQIRYIVPNRSRYDHFSVNQLLGPAQFWVRADEADDASALLGQLDPS